MGVNAQTSVPAFTAGQVLTAAQMTQVNTGIPVFADTTARDAAFGGSGEKVLAEGQFAYIEATDTTQYYDGAAWQSVGAGGLVKVASGTASSGSTVSVNNCFTSTYDNYLILITDFSQTTTVNSFRLRAGGSDNTTSNYDSARIYVDTTASGFDGGTNAGTSFFFGQTSGNVSNSIVIQITNPQTTKQTNMFFSQVSPNAVRTVGFQGFCIFKATTSFDGFSVIASGTISTFNYTVYGYQK